MATHGKQKASVCVCNGPVGDLGRVREQVRAGHLGQLVLAHARRLRRAHALLDGEHDAARRVAHRLEDLLPDEVAVEVHADDGRAVLEQGPVVFRFRS